MAHNPIMMAYFMWRMFCLVYPGDFEVSGGFQIAPTFSRKIYHSLGGPNRSPNITGLSKSLGPHFFGDKDVRKNQIKRSELLSITPKTSCWKNVRLVCFFFKAVIFRLFSFCLHRK